MAYFGLYFVVTYYILFRPSVRVSSEYYLRHRFPEKGRIGRVLDTYQMFLNMGKILVDRATVGILGPENMNLELFGREELLKIVDEDKGFILLLSHVGCWQVALSALRFLKRPVNLLLEYEAGDLDSRYFEHSGPEGLFRIIDPNSHLGGTLDMLEALKRKEILCIMGDRVLGGRKSYVHVQFLGEEAPFPFSAFKIASAAKVPIVVFFTHKTGTKSYALEVAKIIRLPDDLGRSGNDYIPYVTQFVREIVEYVRKHPYQFFNFYDIWHQPVPGTASSRKIRRIERDK